MAPSARLHLAREEAGAAQMHETDIKAGAFTIRSYERLQQRVKDNTVRIYIEGDGLAWLGKARPSLDPTPIRPVALSLARADLSGNVVYLARPCQYNVTYNEQPCPDKYWRGARFSAEVIYAMSRAIDDVKMRHGFQSVELVGFSGGAAIAVLVAARRSDVVSIRTVAGNLDIGAFSRLHDVTPMQESLNPVDFAKIVAHIPQRHFIGGQDKIVTPAIFTGYAMAAGNELCVKSSVVPPATHEEGWASVWANILALPVVCGKNSVPLVY